MRHHAAAPANRIRPIINSRVSSLVIIVVRVLFVGGLLRDGILANFVFDSFVNLKCFAMDEIDFEDLRFLLQEIEDNGERTNHLLEQILYELKQRR